MPLENILLLCRKFFLLGWVPVIGVFTVFSHPAFAQNSSHNFSCESVKNIAIPVQDMPTKDEQKSLDCSQGARAYYYGIGREQNYTKARLCAYLEMAKQDKNQLDFSQMLSGATLLTQIYANGQQVPQNYDLAMHFACSTANTSSQGVDLRPVIQHAKETGEKNPKLNWCKLFGQTTTQPIAVCDNLQNEIARKKYENTLSDFKAKLTPAQKSAFQKLNVAAKNYFANIEFSSEGSGFAIFSQSNQKQLQNNFHNALKDFEKGVYPKKNFVSWKENDDQLNKIYKDIMTGKSELMSDTTITKEMVKQSERNWLKYRDAWVAFCKLRYPSMDLDHLNSMLTQSRITYMKNNFSTGQESVLTTP